MKFLLAPSITTVWLRVQAAALTDTGRAIVVSTLPSVRPRLAAGPGLEVAGCPRLRGGLCATLGRPAVCLHSDMTEAGYILENRMEKARTRPWRNQTRVRGVPWSRAVVFMPSLFTFRLLDLR